MEYKIIQPSFEIKEFDEMTKKEAEKHLDWFNSQIAERLEQLKKVFEQSSRDVNLYNYSPESLKNLWEWFIPLVSTERKSSVEIAEELKKYPEWLRANIEDSRLSILTLSIAIDIGIYLAEVFIRNKSGIKWGISPTRTKSYVNYNRPVLLGFKAGKYDTELNPSRVLNNLALKVAFDGDKNPDLLFNTYNYWNQRIIE